MECKSFIQIKIIYNANADINANYMFTQKHVKLQVVMLFCMSMNNAILVYSLS